MEKTFFFRKPYYMRGKKKILHEGKKKTTDKIQPQITKSRKHRYKNNLHQDQNM